MHFINRLLKALAILLFFASTAFAADDESPVKGAVQDRISLFTSNFSRPTISNRDWLYVNFCDVKTVVRVANGQRISCSPPGRPLKLAGTRTDALKIEPPIKGEWRFENDYSVVFTPSQPWKAGESYRVTYQPGIFPSHVKLVDNGYSFSTTPLNLLSKDMNYLQDPNDPEKKFVTIQLAFNYPVNKESLEKALTCELEAKPPVPIPVSVAFDAEDTQANASITIGALAPEAQFVNCKVAQTVTAADGSAKLMPRAVTPAITQEFAQRVMIPSLFDYLQFSQGSARVLKNSRYVPEQILALESNTPVKAEELGKFTELLLLPKDKPVPNLSSKKDYNWQEPAEVTAEVRAKLEAVPFTVNKEAEAGLINALTFSADGGRYLLLKVKKGAPAPGGYQLGKDYETIVRVPGLPREVKVMAQGALLSLSGEKTLSVLSLGVPQIGYEVGRVKEENLSHLISQTRGSFSDPQFNESYSFNENNISQIFREDRAITNSDPRQPSYSSFDFAPYLKEGKGLYFLTINGKEPNPNDKTGKSFSTVSSDRRFLLITDLGLIVKQNGDGTRDVFVQSIANGSAVADVKISVLGTNGEPVADAVTDSSGHATLPNLDAMTQEKAPVAFVARKGNDLSFLPYGRYDRELNYSKFDVNGNLPTEGLRGYLFSDRGIYRPGETAHVGMIVKARDWSKTAAGVPLVFEVTNPRGQVVNKQLLQMNAEGLMSADYTPGENVATGVYYAALYLGRDGGEKGAMLGDVNLRVEEFQPDRMKMTSAVLQDGKTTEGLAWLKPEQLSADVTLMHLYGAPASDRRVTGKMAIAPGAFGFQSYRDYSFAPEGSLNKTFDETLTETKTDAEGKAKFAINLAKYKDSTFRLTFMGEGFEPYSGRSVKTAKSVLVSPLDYVVGTKSDGNLNYINPNDKRSVSLIAVNASLAKVEAKDLTLELKRSKEVQTLVKNNSGNFEYRSSRIESSIKKDTISIGASGLEYALPTEAPGSYVLVLRGAKDAVLARTYFTVVGEANASGDFTRDATMQLTLDKGAYAAGDEIALNIQSPYTGSGLITIETDRVHSWQWFTATSTNTTQKVKIPAGFEGKGFINVQFTRDLKSKEIFMSPLSFAVAPFTVNIDARDQKITLSAPTEIKPGETVTVQYKSKEVGKVMLYAVDEGILLYGRYQNPDPLDFFLMKQGLEVRTAQIMDLLLPEYSILRSLSAVGGDGFANDGKNLNPFKRKTEPPVAYWSGILESGTDNRNWTFKVPTYFNGSVRILAVGASVNTMGVAEAGLNVRGPLVVTPNLPLFVAPGDTFTVTATVANYVKGSGADAKVKLDVEVSPHLQLVDSPKDAIAIAEGKEASVQLKLKATEVLGSGELRLTANAGSEHFTIAQTTSVRPAVTSMTALISGYVKENNKIVPQPRQLYPEFSEMRAAVSSLPVSLIGGLREYLAKYPYGCTEQMTSQNFPNVILYGNSELIQAFGWKPQEMETALSRSFEQLSERQGDAGGWGMWSYYSQAHKFISAYVMHFMIEAKEKNLPVPETVYENGIRYLKQVVNEQPYSIEDAREKAYGIYLLTRAGEITTNYIPHLLTYLENDQKNIWHNDLVAVYLAATYQQMQMVPEADDLLKKFKLEAPVIYSTSWREYAFYDSLSKYSQYVYLISKHFPKQLEVMDKAVIWRVADFVGEGSYNTVSSSYAVMAIDAYVTARKDALNEVSIIAKGTDGKEQALEVLGQRLRSALIKEPVSEFTFASAQPGFFYQIASSGYDKVLPDKPLSAGLELKREFVDDKGKPVTKAKLGDVVTVKMTLRSGNNEAVPNVAVVDLLPGGFDIEQQKQHSESAPVEEAATADSKPTWQPDFIDPREDRMIMYGKIFPSEYTYSYRIKASTRGTFVVPPAYAESMYDPAVKARGVASQIEVQ